MFRDYSKINEYKEEITKIQFTRENILSSQIFDGDMMVVKCGNYIKFGEILKSKWDPN